LKSASKIGSSTSLRAACTVRSLAVGMPSLRRLALPGLGIIRSRTGIGVNNRALRSSRRTGKNHSAAAKTDSGLTRSTPADRFPRLPRTRAHATTRTAGSQTRLNRSSNRRPGSSVAHWCNLVWIRSTCHSASSSSGHSTPVFTSDLLPFQSLRCELAAALRHVTGFPGLRLLQRLRHAPACSVEHGPPRPRPGGPGRRDQPGTLPTFTTLRSTGPVPSFAPAASPRVRRRLSSWPPCRRLHPARESPARPKRRPGVHRSPARIRQVGAGVSLKRLYTLVPRVHLSVSLGRPRPSGSADPSRRCQGCSRPPRRLPVQAALSFTGLLRQTGNGVLSPPSGSAAPRGARSRRSRRWTGPPRACRCCPRPRPG